MVTTSHEEGKRFIDVNCKAHLSIDDIAVENAGSGKGSLKCSLSILGCTDAAQVGKSMTEYFPYEGGSAGKALNLAEAAGLITAAQRKQANDAGVGMSFDETLLKSQQICGTITMEPNMMKNPQTGKYDIVNPEKPGPYPRIGFNTYSVWSEKAREIPKDLNMLAMVPAPAGWDVARIQQWATGRASAQHGQQQQTTAPSQPATHPATQQAAAAPASPPAVSMTW
jgi:hypothetical protein